MPRKKNGMPFEAHPGPMDAKNGERRLYVRPVSGMKMTLHEMEKFYSYKYSFKNGEMARLFEAFLEIASNTMAMGYSIETPIGVFSPKLELKRELTNPDEINHDDAKLGGINYKCAKAFVKALKEEIGHDGFRYVRKPTSSKIMMNEQHLDEALKKSLRRNKGYTTVHSFSVFSGLTEYSARKVLRRWCSGNNPRLQSTRIGRALIYTEI